MLTMNIKSLPIHFHCKSHWYEYHGIRLSPFLPEASPSSLCFPISGATWHYMPCASYISSIAWSSPFSHHGTFWYSPTLSYCSNLPSAYHIFTQNNMLLQSKVHTLRPTSKPLPSATSGSVQPPTPDTEVSPPSRGMLNSPHLQHGRAFQFCSFKPHSSDPMHVSPFLWQILGLVWCWQQPDVIGKQAYSHFAGEESKV